MTTDRGNLLQSGGSKMSKLELQLAAWAPRILSVLRIMVALLYMQHGLQKLFGFPPPANPMPDPLPPLLLAGGILEAGGGVLFLLGLFTRPVAFILCGMMAVAYFMAHAPRGFFPINNGGDLAILFCFVYLYSVFAGAGSWSLDAVIARKKSA